MIEIMVVMAIMALLAVLGVSAMSGINNGALADKIAETMLSQIRESQNKSFSVASSPTDASIIPLAWGVKIDKTVSIDQITPYYIQDNSTFTYTTVARDTADSKQVQYTIDSIIDSSGTSYNSVFLSYAAPFGKYSVQSGAVYRNPCTLISLALDCSKKNSPPKNVEIKSIDKYMTITFSFRGKSRSIRIEANGEANING